MSQIVVDVEALGGITEQLDRAGERLEAMAGALARASADQTGHRGLSSALDDFGDRWHQGLVSLARAAWGTGDQVGQALRSYEAVERDIAAASSW